MTLSTPTVYLSGARARLKQLALGTGAALSLLGAVPAMAGVVNFESVDPTFYVDGETLSEAGYALQVVDTHGTGALAGLLVNGLDPTTCSLGGCPTDNQSHYYAGLADGALRITRNGGEAFSLASFDYAFVAPIGGQINTPYGQLVLTGTVRDLGTTISYAINFPGTDSAGNPVFSSALPSAAFASSVFTSLTIRACLFDGNGGCTYPQDISDPAYNQAQFALDNINLAEVPEPGSLALLALGMGALTLRRRKSAVSSNRAYQA
ncbi:PEP-CTERM sorting domain-containing protein [Massilia forsythiae]|uniref:PEP-CTERM sorting domain-containing protein n=1 Tax=Massilia forsythiae TaxID=2728020 RepID=A0A7Z2VX25_9BURK|nr:NF038120 family PEP-CTERM protein [Massilia forsythiae]QJE00784.1 PEP-CTERM sorting domain-containing protein [Massilia forsythiae]